MSLETIFRLLIILTLGVAFTVSSYYRRKADQNGGELDPAGNRLIVLLRLSALIVIIPLFAYLINPVWMAWARFDAPVWLRWLGAFISISSVPLIFWLFKTIGNNISPSHTTRVDHKLVTSGPYKYIRHPLYTFGFMMYFGVGLMASMWWLLLGLIIMCGVLAQRTPHEEKQLLTTFGEAYKQYMARTGRYLPKFGR